MANNSHCLAQYPISRIEEKLEMEEDNTLFQEITPEESAVISGGKLRVSFDLNTYVFILGAGVLFGNPGLTSEEVQFAWESAFVFEDAPCSRRRRRNR